MVVGVECCKGQWGKSARAPQLTCHALGLNSIPLARVDTPLFRVVHASAFLPPVPSPCPQSPIFQLSLPFATPTRHREQLLHGV